MSQHKRWESHIEEVLLSKCKQKKDGKKSHNTLSHCPAAGFCNIMQTCECATDCIIGCLKLGNTQQQECLLTAHVHDTRHFQFHDFKIKDKENEVKIFKVCKAEHGWVGVLSNVDNLKCKKKELGKI